MARGTSSGLQVRPALLVVGAACLALGRFGGTAGQDGARLALVVLAAAAVANFVAAFVVVRRTSTEVVDNPTDSTVGEPAGVQVSVTGMQSAVSVRMRSAPDPTWVTAVPPDVGSVPGIAHFRGLATRADIEVCSWGPLGLVGYSRTQTLPLRRTLWIGPRPVVPDHPVDLEPRSGLARIGTAVEAGDGETTRSVREYVPGDPLRRVAWAVTARTGRLVTRELERPASRVVCMAVDLGDEPGRAAERVAGIAAWVGRQVLAGGAQLLLVAMAADGPSATVVNTIGLQRRLAVATGGTPPLSEDRPVLLVSRDGVSWC